MRVECAFGCGKTYLQQSRSARLAHEETCGARTFPLCPKRQKTTPTSPVIPPQSSAALREAQIERGKLQSEVDALKKRLELQEVKTGGPCEGGHSVRIETSSSADLVQLGARLAMDAQLASNQL